MAMNTRAASTTRAASRKKRNKSFAGCWTCRARKVKCDETRPICKQCRTKHLDCQGYDVRLRWMPLEPGSSGSIEDALQHADADIQDAPPHRAQRSLIACVESGQSPLQLWELDQIFYVIDNFQSTSDKSSDDFEDFLFLSNFGVFDSNPDAVDSTDLPKLVQTDDIELTRDDGQDVDPWSPGDAGSLHCQSERLDLSSPLDGFDGNPAPEYAEPVQSSHPSTTPLLFDSHPEYFETGSISESLQVEIGSREDEAGFTTHSRSLWWKTDTGAIVNNPSPFHMPELERFLMNHYVHRVVHLFCVIDYAKSPWKTIHLPRVLQSAGQLSLHGSTSTIRDALRNALLSISAFYLSNSSSAGSSGGEAEKWANDAIKFRGRAIKLLKETVENSTPHSPPKYKELLATMLSMITINVMSGDTSTCGIHLDGAFRFMNHARKSKLKYSSKARSLHRVYFYLRVIYDSTAYRDDDPSSLGSPESDFGTTMSKGLLEDYVDDRTEKSILSHVAAPRAKLGEYEYVYGVPQSLLILLAKTTDLIGVVVAGRTAPGYHVDLDRQCDELEAEILDWVTDSSLESESPSTKIIKETTTAFHNALVIYFAQHIRLMRHSYLRTHIQKVLDSIERIEQIKVESGILAAPLYWPAFIAGSEAFDPELQSRFKAWYVHVEPYRFGSVRNDTSVLHEIWKTGPLGQSRTTSQWRTVVQRTGTRLMLS